MDEDKELHERARAHVNKIKDFYTHIVVYVVINLVLIIINIATVPYIWFVWPLLGWGIGLAMYGLSSFGIFGYFGPSWEQNKINEFMDKNRVKVIKEKERS